MNKSHHRLIVPEMKEIEKDRDREKEGRKGGERAIPLTKSSKVLQSVYSYFRLLALEFFYEWKTTIYIHNTSRE